MESLYTKYRPQTFADVVGQTHVVGTLEHAVMEGRTSHAYLFCGPRGTGKTTMARLLAKALMCEQGAGHLPDGTCEQCRLIAAGEHPDVYELDAASRTGVDNVREEIISRVSFAPVRAPYKMYIIDEVHMLTTAAFNALLKTLEEPPAHVVFVLCTTDPQKIPETILSRVQRFDFHAIGNADIQARLAYICEREGFAYDEEALALVVRHARGGMRDAISELEQLSVSGGGTISVDVARDVLGEVSASTLEKMSLSLANRDVPTLFAQVESLVEVGRDLLQFTRALSARLRDVYVVTAIGERSSAIGATDDELPALSREARAFGSVDRVARALQILSDASTEMRVAPNQRLVLEVALTKIARPQTELTLEALADRVAALERQVAALSTPAARRERAAAEERPATTRAAREAGELPSAQPDVPVAEAPQPRTPVSEVAEATQRPTSAQPSVTTDAPRAHGHQPPATHVLHTQQDPEPTRPTEPAERAQTSESQPHQQAPRMPSEVGAQPASAASAQASIQAVSRPPAPAQSTGESRRQEPAPVAAPVADPGELQRKWKQVIENLTRTHPNHGSLLLSSTLAFDDGERLVVSFPKGSSFACHMLDRKDVRASVDPAVAQVFGQRKAVFAEESVVEAMRLRSGLQAAPAAVSHMAGNASAQGTREAQSSRAAQNGPADLPHQDESSSQTPHRAVDQRTGDGPHGQSPNQRVDQTQSWQAQGQPADQQVQGARRPTQATGQTQEWGSGQPVRGAGQVAAQQAQAAQDPSRATSPQAHGQAAAYHPLDGQEAHGATSQTQSVQRPDPSAQGQGQAAAQQAQAAQDPSRATSPQAHGQTAEWQVQDSRRAASPQAHGQGWASSPQQDWQAQGAGQAPYGQAQRAPQASSWESRPYGDDEVPYDDLDASPYEEDYLFGTVDQPCSRSMTRGFGQQAATGGLSTKQQPSAARQEAPSSGAAWQAQFSQQAEAQQPFGNQQASRSYDAPQQPHDSWQSQNPQPRVAPRIQQQEQVPQYRAPWEQEEPQDPQAGAAQEARPHGEDPQYQAPWESASSQTPEMPEASQPLAAAETPVPTSQEAASPSPEDIAASADTTGTAPAGPNSSDAWQGDAAQASADTPSTPKPTASKRTPRKTGGIPADIVALMTRVFGEGVTYTTIAPDEPNEADEDAREELADDEYVSDDGYDVTSDYVDDPLDDADYDDADDDA